MNANQFKAERRGGMHNTTTLRTAGHIPAKWVELKFQSELLDSEIKITATISEENHREIWFDVEGRFSTLAEMLLSSKFDLSAAIKKCCDQLKLIDLDRMRIRISRAECREKSLTGFIYQI